MPNITTLTGDATSPRPESGQPGIIIAHICNDGLAWGAGFVLAVNSINNGPKLAYQNFPQVQGTTQFVEALPRLFISNMIAQSLAPKGAARSCLVDYDHLRTCLKVTFTRAISWSYDVHIPSGIGSGLAGGDKDTIIKLIEDVACDVEKTFASQMAFPRTINITLWDFVDTSASSFICTSNNVSIDG